MNYLQTLEEQATLLGYACTVSGKKAHVTGFSLINEILAAQAVAQPGVPSPLVNSLSDAAIAQLTEVMQRVTNTTFNEAVPMIKNVMEKLQQVVNPDIPVAYSQHEIVPVIFSDLWDTPMVMEMAEKGKKVSPGNLEITGLIQSLDAEEYGDLLALAQTGLGQLDSEIRKVFGGKAEDELRALFTGVFGSGYLPSQNPKDLMTSGTMDEWILIVLWCNKLYEMAPKQSAFSLERYRLGIVAIEQLAFSVVSAVDSQRRAFSDAGRLVVERIGKKVYVVNDRYASFLKEGGSPEAILGLLLTEPAGSNRNTTVEEIRKVQGQLEQAWNRHVQISSVTHTQQMAATARRQLHLIMEEVAKFHYGDDQGKVPADLQGQYVATRDKLAACIQALPEDFTRDAHRWVFDMVGKCFYEGTDVNRMLNNLREVGDSTDGEMSAEEVKVIAAINFVADWSSDIVAFSNHGLSIDFQQIRSNHMGMEAFSFGTAAKIGAGIAILALIGMGIYMLLEKSSSNAGKLKEVENKLDTAVEDLTSEVDRVEEAITEAKKSGEVVVVPPIAEDAVQKTNQPSANTVKAGDEWKASPNQIIALLGEERLLAMPPLVAGITLMFGSLPPEVEKDVKKDVGDSRLVKATESTMALSVRMAKASGNLLKSQPSDALRPFNRELHVILDDLKETMSEFCAMACNTDRPVFDLFQAIKKNNLETIDNVRAAVDMMLDEVSELNKEVMAQWSDTRQTKMVIEQARSDKGQDADHFLKIAGHHATGVKRLSEKLSKISDGGMRELTGMYTEDEVAEMKEALKQTLSVGKLNNPEMAKETQYLKEVLDIAMRSMTTLSAAAATVEVMEAMMLGKAITYMRRVFRMVANHANRGSSSN